MSLDQCLNCEHSCIGCTVDCTFWEGPCASYEPNGNAQSKQKYLAFLDVMLDAAKKREQKNRAIELGGERWLLADQEVRILNSVIQKAKEVLGE